jgi:hypothetical protein
MTSAYAAGLIDGEGCILIQQSRGPSFHHLLTVGMTEKALAVLHALTERYGGQIKMARAATEKWDAAYSWTAAGQQCTDVLLDVQPHLILKAEQARIALLVAEIRRDLPLRFPGTRSAQRMWTDEARTRCSTLKRRMHELNAKGPTSLHSKPPGAKRIARRVAGHWVTDQSDLLSDLGWEQFSGPWPVSGMTRGGTAYALPTWEQRTDVSESSSSRNLPTPTARDWKDSQIRREPHRPNDTDTLSRALADLLLSTSQDN